MAEAQKRTVRNTRGEDVDEGTGEVEQMAGDPYDTVRRLARGELITELYEALAQTAKEVVETGKKGTVTLTLAVSTQGIGDPMVIITETIARSAPKKDPRGAYFYSVGGGLHKEDPRQTRMELRTVEGGRSELRATDDQQPVVREVR
jgi:hypothetical protein